MKTGPPGPIRVLIADDHPLTKQGVRAYLNSKPGIQVVGEASDGLEALEVSRALCPDVLIADISMPELSGIEVVRSLAFAAPQVKVLLLSMHEDRDIIEQARHAGARGYLLKNGEPQQLLRAVELIQEGAPFVTYGKSRLLLEKGASPPSPEPPKYYPSPREGQVLSCLVAEMTSKQIAHILSLSPRTVECHRENLKKRLGIRTTAGLVKYGITHGFGTAPRKPLDGHLRDRPTKRS